MLRLAPPRLRRMRQFSLFFALLLVVFLCYRQTFHSPLVLDDVSSFVEVQSVHVADFSVESLRQISRSPFGVARVIPMLSFAVDHQLGGGSIVQFHLTNLVIHLLATTAVFFFVFSLLETTVGRKALKCLPPATFAFFVAALWALNPVQTNAVTYIVQRMASLAALFYCLACVFYLRSRLAGNLRCRWGW
ncbi:MAG: hypothetical protein OEV91_10155, partial [Desulfobulbaceae bacterium]|nr:hypothetical protein [Desulfobulbaceae bacterium]